MHHAVPSSVFPHISAPWLLLHLGAVSIIVAATWRCPSDFRDIATRGREHRNSFYALSESYDALKKPLFNVCVGVQNRCLEYQSTLNIHGIVHQNTQIMPSSVAQETELSPINWKAGGPVHSPYSLHVQVSLDTPGVCAWKIIDRDEQVAPWPWADVKVWVLDWRKSFSTKCPFWNFWSSSAKKKKKKLRGDHKGGLFVVKYTVNMQNTSFKLLSCEELRVLSPLSHHGQRVKRNNHHHSPVIKGNICVSETYYLENSNIRLILPDFD